MVRDIKLYDSRGTNVATLEEQPGGVFNLNYPDGRMAHYNVNLDLVDVLEEMFRVSKPATRAISWTFTIRRKASTSEYVTLFYLNGCERRQARSYCDSKIEAEQTGREECSRLNKAQYIPA